MKYKCLIIIASLFFSYIIISETIDNQGKFAKGNEDYDFINQKEEIELNELRLSLLFDAIRKGNNVIA